MSWSGQFEQKWELSRTREVPALPLSILFVDSGTRDHLAVVVLANTVEIVIGWRVGIKLKEK